jgi:hypothetical protein
MSCGRPGHGRPATGTSHGDVTTFEEGVGDWPSPSQMTIRLRTYVEDFACGLSWLFDASVSVRQPGPSLMANGGV